MIFDRRGSFSLSKQSWHAGPAAQGVVLEVAPVVLEGELVRAAVGVVAGVEAGRGVGPGDVELIVRPKWFVGHKSCGYVRIGNTPYEYYM